MDAMMAWASDPQVAAFCRWEPYESTEPLLAFLRDSVLPHPWYRAICVSGAVSVSPTPERCRGELGYVLARAHWGKGVATAAVRRALRDVFADLEPQGLRRVEALVDVGNPASQRVAEKAGFRREGLLRRHYWHKGRARDMVMYSFLSSDLFPE
jgi:RimJ/RimL family protein N-acetyltransferase